MVLNKSFRVFRRWRPCRSVLLESKNISSEALLFESDTIAILTPTETEVIRREYNQSDSAYGCLGVLVYLEVNYLVMVTGCSSIGKIGDAEVYRITQTMLVPLHVMPTQNEAVAEVGKLLASGRFYFSLPTTGSQFLLLNRAQKRDQERIDFRWNRNLFVYMQRFGIDTNRWVWPVMCGSVLFQTVYAGEKKVKTCLISRLSCERAGTRFNVRGLNDEGHVANFVETEQVLYTDTSVISFVQVRGLVPVFWDQPGIQTGTNRIRLSRGFQCSHPAFEKHFESLLGEYGPVLCVNLLGQRDMEPLLTEAYQVHMDELSLVGAAEMVNFDYHTYCRPGHLEALGSVLLPLCEKFLESNGFFVSHKGVTEKAQTGTLRANCLDCLDRSNSAQKLFGLWMIPKMLAALGVPSKSTVTARFRQLLQRFWVQNGDNISRIYAGTRALEKSTSKVAKIRDGALSVQRTIRNNFMDSGKQEAMDILLCSAFFGELGQMTKALLASEARLSYPMRRTLCNRWQDFTDHKKLRVFVGTWNVNGGRHMRSVALKNQSMHEWLLDAPATSGKTTQAPEMFESPADIYAIGFQELVGLTAANLVSTSSCNRHEWGMELERVLSRDHPYCLVTAEQLVGVCLYIFVRPHLIPYIRDVAVTTAKTGIGGKAGNKGAVSVHLLLHSTSLCFVCSHLAAHQTKILERNQDFADICRKISFPLCQTIESHDYIFWCGDLNYRIDLPGSLAKDAIAQKDWDKLHRHDQLIKQKKLNKVFRGYVEGELTFAPTYKYDQFSDDYDTSEKCRVPAWCDRVLWKRRSFLPALDHQRMARLRDSDAGKSKSKTNGKFGLHSNDASRVYERELSSGEKALEWWHPGKLLHYGRAELKTSDHRPVMAIFEIDIFRVDERKKKVVIEEVESSLGPIDPTVEVAVDGQDSKNTIEIALLLELLQECGNIVLIRATDESTLVTFQHSYSALEAVKLSGKKVGDVKVSIRLRQQTSSPSQDREESGRRREGRVTVLTRAQLGGEAGADSELEPPPVNEDLSFGAEDDDEDAMPDELETPFPPLTQSSPEPSPHPPSRPPPPQLSSAAQSSEDALSSSSIDSLEDPRVDQEQATSASGAQSILPRNGSPSDSIRPSRPPLPKGRSSPIVAAMVDTFQHGDAPAVTHKPKVAPRPPKPIPRKVKPATAGEATGSNHFTAEATASGVAPPKRPSRPPPPKGRSATTTGTEEDSPPPSYSSLCVKGATSQPPAPVRPPRPRASPFQDTTGPTNP